MGYIYNIINKVNGAIYVGSTITTDPRKRWWRHIKDLHSNIHHSRHLQRAWNKYGCDRFEFRIVKVVLDKDILTEEQSYLNDRKNNYPSKLNYNECWIAGNCTGRKVSQKTREKIKQAHLGMKQSEKTKEKKSFAWDKKCKTPYSFTSPDGIVYNNVRNLRRFGRKHNLNAGCLRLLHNKKIKYHRGWFVTDIPPVYYKLISPDGLTLEGLVLKELCRKGKVNYKMIHRYCVKKNKPYNGWFVIVINRKA